MIDEIFSSASERLWFSAVVAGVVALLLVVSWVVRRRSKKPGETYDERQKLVRGMAYRASLLTLIGWCTFYGAVGFVTRRNWFAPGLAGLIGVLLAVGVLGAVCILKDAFRRVGERSQIPFMILLGVMALKNGFSGAAALSKGTVILDGAVTYDALYLVFAAFCLVEFGFMLGKALASARADAAGDEE